MAGIIENGVVTVRFVTPMSVVSNQPVFVADSLSLKRQVVSQGVQRWEIDANLEPSNNSADFLLHSVTNGYDRVFDIQMPQVFRQQGSLNTATNIRVVGNYSVNTSTLQVNSNGLLSKGEFIKFANHDKIYLVLNNISQNSNTSLQIFPSLQKPVTNNTFIGFGKNVIMKARYEMNTILGITYIDGVLSDPGTVTFIEVL